MRITHLRQRLHDLGAKPCHEDRLLRGWSQLCSYDKKGSPAATFFPAALRNELPAIEAELNGLARLHGEYPDGEGVARLLVELRDGQMVESVLLPRGGLCVSTQVGCAVGCVFCMSGRNGLLRQLGSAEIVAQVVLARKRRKVGKVVFMGMGEPAHNLDNVLEAIEVLGTQGNIGHKNLVLSTVGDLRVFERLMDGCGSQPEISSPQPSGATTSHSTKPASGQVAGYPEAALSPPLSRGNPLPNPLPWKPSPQPSPARGRGGNRERQLSIPAGEGAIEKGNFQFLREREQTRMAPFNSCGRRSNREKPPLNHAVKPALALSLHTTDEVLRARLLPHAPQIPIEELVDRAEAYARATHHPVQYQWTLIEGINDSDAELERIARLLSGKYAIMNFIPFNDVDGLPYRRPSPGRIAFLAHTLNRRGVLTRIRDSAGQEIEGACGQLRARAAKAR